MIDIHNHILPGLDDGPQDLKETLQMARVAFADGVSTIIATPHSNDLDELPADAFRSSLDEARKVIAPIGLTILPGLENYLTPDLPGRYLTGKALTLGDSHYMLVEFPLSQYPLYTEKVLFELQLKGITPVIAHPERNEAIQQDVKRLQKLVERGMLSQITTASLLGEFGPQAKRTAVNLLAHNMAHVIASDAHAHDGHRNPTLTKGVEAAARIVGKERAMAMVTEIPEAILADRAVDTEPPLAVPHRSWAFWRR